MRNSNQFKNKQRQIIRENLLGFLIQAKRSMVQDELVAGYENGIQIPLHLFKLLSQEDIIATCNIINDDATQPFLIAHEWSDEDRRRDHSIVAYVVDASLKASVESMNGRYVMANWGTLTPWGLFVAKVTGVNPKPFIDLHPLEDPELQLQIQFYVDPFGQLIEPSQPINITCDRHMLSCVLKALRAEELAEMKAFLMGSLKAVNH